MKGLTAKSRIALGQTGLLTSIVLTAAFLGVMPDERGAVREGRAALAEAVAANSSILFTATDLKRLQVTLELVVGRNDDLVSAGLRRADDVLVISIGDHADAWREMEGEHSTETQVRVPIWQRKGQWGELELRFRPLVSERWYGVLQGPWVKLVGFIALFSFVAFYFYLGRMLKHLDPSQAVPARVRSALDTLAEGLLVLDSKANVVLANQAFADMLGRRPEELVGQKASDFPWVAGGDGSGDGHYPWLDALQQGTLQPSRMMRMTVSDSAQRTFMVSCSPVLTGSRRPGGVLVSLDDVTELEEKELELRRSKDEAEAANRAKSDFLANMSHEIRTPMNAILGFAEVLKRGYGKSPADSRKHLNTILSSGKHLLQLINDILDLSKVEAGKLEIEQARFAPHAIIHEVVKILQVKAQEKGVALEFEPHGPQPETILSDQARLRQIVTNLIGNAIKFTEKGGVTVVTRLVEHEGEARLAVDVTDTGIGMTPEGLKGIFNPFVQADTSVTRRFGGTGLGLSISRRFAQALGGNIEVQSRLGEGSTFTATIATGALDDVKLLEADELTLDEADVDASGQTHWAFPSARVLVVDDGRENRELVVLVLEEVGLSVDEAENGQLGVEKALETDYDVILMDVQMPVMDGMTAVRLLRGRGLETPVVALTGNAMKGVEEECLAAGFSNYMPKPINIDGLIRLLADLLGGRRVAEPQPSTAVPEPFESSQTPLEGQTAPDDPITSALASNPRFEGLIERFVDRLWAQLGEMNAAWERQDFDELAALAHWLKGSGGTVGFDVFTAPARELEELAKARDDTGAGEVILVLHQMAGRLVTSVDGSAIEELTKEQSAPQDRVASAPAPAGEPAAPRARITSALAGDPRFQVLIKRFVDRLRERLAEMDAALERQDFDELAALAHWLKGAGGTVGFDDFTEPACELEKLAKTRNGAGASTLIRDLHELTARLATSGDGSTGDQPMAAAGGS